MPKIEFSEFMKRLKNKDQNILNEYKFDSTNYNGITSKINITHNICGNTFNMVCKNFLNGQRCPKCAQIKRNNALIKYIDVQTKDDSFDLIKYFGKTKKNLFKCKKCNYEILATNKLIKKIDCPNCSIPKVNKINKNIEKYQKNLLNYNVEILPDYFTSTIKKSKFKCTNCNNYFIGYYNNIIQNKKSTCPFCYTNKEKTIINYQKRLEEMNLDKKYEILNTNFKNATHEKIKFYCKTCNQIFEKTLVDFFSNKQFCPNCAKNSNKKHYSKNQINNILKDINLEIIGEYINRYTITEFKCTICNTKFKTKLKYILDKKLRNNQTYCPKCNTINYSNGELAIKNYLEKNNIKYLHDKSIFKDLYYKNSSTPLRIDFYIEELNTVIEFNGIQHYQPIDYFGGEEAFKELQIRDSLKIDYCKNHNIDMIIIPYYDFKNIENILNNYFTF